MQRPFRGAGLRLICGCRRVGATGHDAPAVAHVPQTAPRWAPFRNQYNAESGNSTGMNTYPIP